jgi:AraC family transcriptional activator of tynA and feaB
LGSQGLVPDGGLAVHPSFAAPSATRFSTLAVPPRQRVEFWKDAICAVFVPLDFECDTDRPFSSDLAIRRTPRFDVIDVLGSPQEVRRSDRHIRADGAENLIVMLQRQGSGWARQDECELGLSSTSLTVLDSRRPYSLRFHSDFRQTVLKVPALELEQRIGRTAGYMGHGVDARSALGRLACTAIDEVAREPRDSAVASLSTVALDLLALALLQSRGPDDGVPRMAALRVRWALATALELLREPQLTPRSIAARQGVSPRLLQRLFAAEGMNLSDFILEQRLLRAARDLQDPRQLGRSITEIAMSWGFNDAGRFSKAFRRRFGVSASEARRTPEFASGPA